MIGFGSSSERLQWLLLSRRVQVVNSITQLGFLRSYFLFSFKSLSSLSNTIKKPCLLTVDKDEPKEHSFTVSYLVSKCGLSLESAESVSKKVNFENPHKPDGVINFLRNYGFSNTQISELITTQPRLISADPVNTLLPKLEFLVSVGVSSSDLYRIVRNDPGLLFGSLEKFLIPGYNTLKSILSSDDKVAKALSLGTFSRISRQKVRENLVFNVSVLRKLGVPESTVCNLVSFRPSVGCLEPEKFSEAVNNVIEIGFDTGKNTFVDALRVIAQMSKETWKHKIEVYGRWGLTKDEIWFAFKKSPRCMTHSEKKIMNTMDFLVNKMAWEPSVVAKTPTVFGHSLEKRIVPRCSVIRILQLRGLVGNEISLCSMVHSPEKQFFDSFVIKYKDDIPQLLSIYQGNMSIMELGFEFEDKNESKDRRTQDSFDT